MPNRSQMAVILILVVAVVAASFAWWYRQSQGRRSLKFWGSSQAMLIRFARNVELLELARSENHGDGLTIGSQLWQIESRRDITEARGLVHARQAFIEDASFDWAISNRAPYHWDHALVFSGENGHVTVAIDLTGEQICVVESNRTACVTPIVAGLKDFLAGAKTVPEPAT